jgi:hypothetical protein
MGDALEEARVYAAYGRTEQARAVLRLALTRDPARADVRVMLASLEQRAAPAAGTPANSIGELLLWFVIVPVTMMLPGVAIIGYAFFFGTTELAIGGAAVLGLGLMALGKVLCRLHAQGRIVVRGGFLQCPPPGEITVRLGAWWSEPGIYLGMGVWILGLYAREPWILALGLVSMVIALVSAGRFSARDPASRAAVLLAQGRKDAARALASAALARKPNDTKLRALIEIIDKDSQRP